MVRRMRRYRRRPRRRTMMRRRFRRSRRVGVRYDSGVKLKCHTINDITYDSTYQAADFSINWGSDNTTTNNYARILDNDEFQNFQALYREWRLIGVKFSFLPITTVTSVANSNMYSGSMIHYVGGLPNETFPTATLLSQQTFKWFNPSRMKSFYVNAGRYYAGRNQKWLPVGTYYEDAGSLLRVNVTGYGNGTIVGRVHVTWYVQFRGQTS